VQSSPEMPVKAKAEGSKYAGAVPSFTAAAAGHHHRIIHQRIASSGRSALNEKRFNSVDFYLLITSMLIKIKNKLYTPTNKWTLRMTSWGSINQSINLRIALGGKKSPQLSFWISKKILSSIGRGPFVTFPEYEVVQNATTRSPIDAPEAIHPLEVGKWVVIHVITYMDYGVKA